MNPIRRPFRYSYNSAAFYIIGINLLVFVLQNLSRTLTYYLCLTPASIFRGWVWQFVTYMFVHDTRVWTHILFNMLALFFFGTQVERRMGSKEFVLYYLLTGALSGAFSFLFYWFTGSGAYILGASGAIFAVELAYATFFPDSVIYLWGLLPLRAPVMVLGYTALELVSSLTARQSGVAHLTHLAGFGFGWIYFLLRFRANPWRYLFRRR
jgi:membrane associated rhomboid family serine protease